MHEFSYTRTPVQQTALRLRGYSIYLLYITWESNQTTTVSFCKLKKHEFKLLEAKETKKKHEFNFFKLQEIKKHGSDSRSEGALVHKKFQKKVGFFRAMAVINNYGGWGPHKKLSKSKI